MTVASIHSSQMTVHVAHLDNTKAQSTWPAAKPSLLANKTSTDPPTETDLEDSTGFGVPEEYSQTQCTKLLEEYSEMFSIAAMLLIARKQTLLPIPLANAESALERSIASTATSKSFCVGYFTCQDISTVLIDGYAIPLGYLGDICRHASKPLLMTIGETNGVHTTKVTFFRCDGSASKWHQLLAANLLPATIQTLQSNITGYNYVRALQCMTNNVFTGNVLDCYKQFMFIMRIWLMLLAAKRFGEVYGNAMDILVNMEPGRQRIPKELRHINALHLAVDRNFQTNHYAKNGDPNDVPLFTSRGYMPDALWYKEYLKDVPQLQNEKPQCGHIKAISGQDKQKFKNTNISGTVNCNCDHIMIGAAVNMVGGREHFATTDLAIALNLDVWPFEEGKEPDLIISYNSMCYYCKNIIPCFMAYHPSIAHRIRSGHFIIPIYHCQNHVPECNPLYSYKYKPNMAHFHSESIEFPWPYFNTLGPSIWQMNPGQRIDTLELHYGGWNYRKLTGMDCQLLKELQTAKIAYIDKQDHFVRLCRIYKSEVKLWNTFDCSPCIDLKAKNMYSVYFHNNTKAPTLQGFADAFVQSDATVHVSTGEVNTGSVAQWLIEGLAIMQLQVQVQRIAKSCQDSPTKELHMCRAKLTERISKFQKDQKCFMHLITPLLASEPFAEAKNEKLFLPLDFSMAKCSELCLDALATKQVNFLDVALGEVVNSLQMVVKTISAAYKCKIKHARGQEQNTHLNTKIWTIMAKQTDLILDYQMLHDVEGNLWTLTSVGLISKVDEHGKVFGDYAADRAEKEEDNESEDPAFEGGGQYLGTKMLLRQAWNISKLQQPMRHKSMPVPVQESEPDPEEESAVLESVGMPSKHPSFEPEIQPKSPLSQAIHGLESLQLMDNLSLPGTFPPGPTTSLNKARMPPDRDAQQSLALFPLIKGLESLHLETATTEVQIKGLVLSSPTLEHLETLVTAAKMASLSMDTLDHGKLFSSSAEFYEHQGSMVPDTLQSLDMSTAMQGLTAAINSRKPASPPAFRPGCQFGCKQIPVYLPLFQCWKSRSPPSSPGVGKVAADEVKDLDQLDKTLCKLQLEVLNDSFNTLSEDAKYQKLDTASML
ncbi:hypothetical protein BT96DRAFT_1001104 [Gymnopus androsaceus JB14]|uniref:CxC2-like cysteine cluster KDZ transposase-associated domain-containing protein n=1 Tax=Gymnopus androsaceus JB14 TaxID=1447944 RepID=A0A6A4H0T1_9AGAR|nr:hypothetical protein BT96DRAFT_1001104 [Gymnopus androsaceus JB14]